MKRIERRSAARGGQGRGISKPGAVLLLAAVVVGTNTTAASAATTSSFNPFDLNSGFTILSQGDVFLNNGEVEGAVAAYGTIESGNPNGYPVIHSAAGEADYTVPTVDGTPVRILAGSFTGAGSFDLSNRDDSNTIAADSAEALAVMKLVSVDGLTANQRGGGAGPAAGSDFLRATNAQSGNVDLKVVPFAGTSLSTFATAESSVSAYFDVTADRVAQVSDCLTGLYGAEAATAELSSTVTVETQGDMVFLSEFAADRANVIDYAAIAGKTIKMDRAAGYKPTAAAPLIIKVSADTETLGQLRFEGWSPAKGADQTLARYIMLDATEVTGDLAVDGLELGSIWAPNANLHFNSGTTTNGQWFAQDVTTAGGGEVHHHAFLGQLTCVSTDPTPGSGPNAGGGDPDDSNDPNGSNDPNDPNDPNGSSDPDGSNTPGGSADENSEGPADEVVTTVTTSAQDSSGELARTGDTTDRATLIGAGLAAAAAGAAAILFARRRITAN